MPKLIKEQHLDPDFLRRLYTGGSSANFDAALLDYVKKTDIIHKSQIDSDYIDEVAEAIQAVENQLDNYYQKSDQIGRANISSEFEADISTLEARVAQLGQISENLNNAIADGVDSYIQGSTIVSDITNTVVQNVQDATGSVVGTVSEHTAQISDLSDRISNNELANQSTQDQLDILEDTVGSLSSSVDQLIDDLDAAEAILERIQNIDSDLDTFRAFCESTYRKLDDAIMENDLDPDFVASIDNLKAVVSDLQGVTGLEPVLAPTPGATGQVATLDYEGMLIGQDLLSELYLYENSDDVYYALNKMFPNVVDVTNRKIYTITNPRFNANIVHNQQKETVALDEEEKVIIMTEHDDTVIPEYTESADPNEVNWPKDDTGEGYQIVTLASQYIDEGDVSLNISDSDIVLHNEADEESYVVIGFYGTKFRLFGDISSSGLQLSFEIDNIPYTIDYNGDKAGEDLCIFCIEGLSEGPHRLVIWLSADQIVTLSQRFMIDDTHAALIYKEDIFPAEFYNISLYDGGNYFRNYNAGDYGVPHAITITHTNDYPNDLKSTTLMNLGISWYQQDELDLTDLKYLGKFIYNPDTQILYYYNQNKFTQLTTSMKTLDVDSIFDELDSMN